MFSSTIRAITFFTLAAAVLLGHPAAAQEALPRQLIEFRSTADGSTQQAYLIMPRAAAKARQEIPVVVSLHSWSAGFEQRKATLERAVHERGWIFLFPNFRGANRNPAACGSKLAQQDILDSIAAVAKRHSIDERHIYLTGASGGGHMTMLMVGRYPDRWRAASAWVGISDLASWHAKHKGQKYGNMVEACCGGPPGKSSQVDAEYRARSPLTHLAAAKNVAIDIATGIHDGHTGSVPIRHSIDAFNKIAVANGRPPVSGQEIQELSQRDGRLSSPAAGDVGFDPTFDRKYFLRRTAGRARLTVFDGGHEGITNAIMAWFDKHAGK